MRGRERNRRAGFGLTAIAMTSIGLIVAWDAYAQQSISAGSWTGGTRYNETGTFDYCYISSNTPSGRSITFVVSATNAWLLFFSDPDWRLNKDDNFDSTLSIDNVPLTNGKVLAITDNQVGTGIPNEAIVFDRLRSGHVVTLALPWGTFKFSLNGSTKALKAADECRTKHAAPVSLNTEHELAATLTASVAANRRGT